MKTLNGQSLKLLFLSGSNNLYNHYPEVDALNVFPVPDGDTGMNMNLTLTSGSKEIQNRNDENASEISKVFSRGLLMGARGNSGVITSQIFRGFSKGLNDVAEIDALTFSAAFQKGVEAAYKAVVNPVEGTILTVIRESSQFLADKVKDNMSIEKCLDLMLQEARESLKRTPELLPVLKEAGVIDSGGAGLVRILEGMRVAAGGGFVERSQATATELVNNLAEDEEDGYLLDFVLKLSEDKKTFNANRFVNILSTNGSDLLVDTEGDILKVHIQVLNPGDILNYAQQYGEFLKVQLLNLKTQNSDEQFSFIDEESAKEKKEYAMIGVSSGEGIEQFFREVGISVIVKGGQTMNPSSEDFVSAIKKANAKNVFIFPNNSNIVMAASQACEMVDKEGVNVYVIPSKTIPQGISSAITFNPELDAEENFRCMKAALKNVKSGEVTYAIRDTEYNGLKVKKDDYIGIYEKEIVVDNPDKIEALMFLLDKMVDNESSIITILVGQDVDEKTLEKVTDKVTEKYSDLDLDIREGNQPVYSFLVGVE
ncbi:MAG TPA: DAK2 domain-containing protein [Erysipelotrichaceae bacterium]|nr:DAK2 domain-containing protein [Erysipelotrichaceae bacterium]